MRSKTETLTETQLDAYERHLRSGVFRGCPGGTQRHSRAWCAEIYAEIMASVAIAARY